MANGRMSTSAGTYSLRRSNYQIETKRPQLSVEEQCTLIQLFREGDNDAKRKLVAHNMHLVVDFAKVYANRGLSLLDLVRVGTQGIIESLETYEPEGDLNFSAYASKRICRDMEEAIMSRTHSAAMLRAAAPQLATFVNVGTQRRNDGHLA
jgi:DNA-directed RNA polymerase sigma subunit (sigma70/sigma32)